VYPNTFLSEEIVQENFKGLDIRMIKLQLADPANVSFASEPTETAQSVAKMNVNDAPC
jgi:hypothetical protein